MKTFTVTFLMSDDTELADVMTAIDEGLDANPSLEKVVIGWEPTPTGGEWKPTQTQLDSWRKEWGN